jgi:hypothetical protein
VGIRAWFAARRRADALRRLGGPDVDEERKRNAMNGEQKGTVLIAMTGAILVGWIAWTIASYNTTAAALEASAQPTTEAVLNCVNYCARSCADQSMEAP